MPDKPATAAGYRGKDTERVRAICLYIATRLGTHVDDIVAVGGLVPSLLVPAASLPDGTEAHVGTQDLDLGLAVGILESGRYEDLALQLRRAGFVQATNLAGNPMRQRWVMPESPSMMVDFLIAPSRPDDRGGQIRGIEGDFAAVVTPGLHLAFVDRECIVIQGRTIRGEAAERSVKVCGPGAYVVLKALAFDGRGESKDAYDLHYVVRNYGAGAEEVAHRLARIAADPAAEAAVAVLRRDFTGADSVGPLRVAEFLFGGRHAETQADVAGDIRALLDRLPERTAMEEG